MIETARLRLRPCRESDKPAFAAILNTPAMMADLGGVRSTAEIDTLVQKCIADQARHGCSYWAVELRATAALIGTAGIRVASNYAGAPIAGMYEIGWRIAEPYWGCGYAREAAEASIAWGWANTTVDRIGAWTTIGNTRSWGLMERLGMTRHAELDFHHPKVATDDPDGAMIVYAIDRPA